VDHLSGVDLSPGMLERCGAVGYDELSCADLVDHAGELATGTIDLVVAADVLIYLGELGPLFAEVGRALAPGGWWLYSVEVAPDGDYQLTDTGRYVHGRAYLDRLAEGAGLEVVARDQITLRRERGAPVTALVVAARRA